MFAPPLALRACRSARRASSGGSASGTSCHALRASSSLQRIPSSSAARELTATRTQRLKEKKKNPKRQHRKGGKEKQTLPGQGSFEQEEIEEHIQKQEDEAVQADA